MQLKEFNILLDIKKHNKTDYFEVVQGDLNSNVLNIALVDGLNPYNLAGTNVEIVFSKPDGTTVQQTDITIINATQGRIQCILKTNTIASPGKVIAEVRVLEGETLLTSTRFEFYVRKSLITDETIESTNEFPILTQLINTTNDLIDQVEQIEKQVPEQVVTDLNAVSVLANQLQVDLAAHKAESATWIRIDTLSAPIELPSGGIEDAISVPTSEIISASKVYAIEFRLRSSDVRSSSISICVGVDTSASGIIVGSPLNLPNLTDIFVANRLKNSNSPNEILFYALRSINGNIVPCYVYRIFRLKEGVIY